jgi:hypothetical protein
MPMKTFMVEAPQREGNNLMSGQEVGNRESIVRRNPVPRMRS